MKFQQLERAFLNKKSSTSSSSSSSTSSSSLSLGFKRFRALVPAKPVTALGHKNFSFPKASSTHLQHQHESLSGGGTRWNPAHEQIRKLEALYKSGIRTPNAQQIEKITAELIKHGRIEGKNVFYWFQNHKARERQKQKRNGLLSPSTSMDSDTKGTEEKKSKDARSKRRSRSWGLELDQINECISDDRATLDLFPLHPEKIKENI